MGRAMGTLDQPPFPIGSTLSSVWYLNNLDVLISQMDLFMSKFRQQECLPHDPTLKHQWGYFGKD